MSNKKVDADINFGNIKFVSVKSNLIVTISDSLILHTENGEGIELRVDIRADLESVPERYREVFLNILTSKYLNKVSFSDNPFSACQQEKKKHWWQFWKNDYFLKKIELVGNYDNNTR